MLVGAIRRRKKINDSLTRSLCVASVLAIVGGSMWIIITMMKNADEEWIPGAIIAAAGYLVLFFAAFKK